MVREKTVALRGVNVVCGDAGRHGRCISQRIGITESESISREYPCRYKNDDANDTPWMAPQC
jgi:hypothetical protein